RPTWEAECVRKAGGTSTLSHEVLLLREPARWRAQCGRRQSPEIPNRAGRRRFHSDSAEPPSRQSSRSVFSTALRARPATPSRRVRLHLLPRAGRIRTGESNTSSRCGTRTPYRCWQLFAEEGEDRTDPQRRESKTFPFEDRGAPRKSFPRR